MSHNCASCDVKSIALPNIPSNSLIPKSIDLNSTSAIINNETDYARCVHGCKTRMYRLIENEPNRVQFLPIKYSGRSKFAKAIKEYFSKILVEGAPHRHFA